MYLDDCGSGKKLSGSLEVVGGSAVAEGKLVPRMQEVQWLVPLRGTSKQRRM